MNIVVLNDDRIAANAIMECLRDASDALGVKSQCQHAICINDARKLLKETHYDLLVLDLALPSRLDSAIDPDGGVEFLREIHKSKTIMSPSRVVALTAHYDLWEKSKSVFADLGTVLCRFGPDSDRWRSTLSTIITQIAYDEKIGDSIPREYGCDILIVAAMFDPEMVPFHELLENVREREGRNETLQHFSGELELGEKTLSVVLVASPSMGLTEAAIATTIGLRRYNPRVVVIPGIMAGNRERTNIGDVIVASEVWNCDAGKYTEKDGEVIFELRANHVVIDQGIVKVAESLGRDATSLFGIKQAIRIKPKPSTELRLHVGCTASGGAVVASTTVREEIEAHNSKMMGLDMEIYAVYRACMIHQPRALFFSCKSVVDHANGMKNDDFRYFAAETSSRVALELLRRLWSQMPPR